MPAPTTTASSAEQSHTARDAPEVQISTEEQHEELLAEDEEMDPAADRDRIRVVRTAFPPFYTITG